MARMTPYNEIHTKFNLYNKFTYIFKSMCVKIHIYLCKILYIFKEKGKMIFGL